MQTLVVVLQSLDFDLVVERGLVNRMSPIRGFTPDEQKKVLQEMSSLDEGTVVFLIEESKANKRCFPLVLVCSLKSCKPSKNSVSLEFERAFYTPYTDFARLRFVDSIISSGEVYKFDKYNDYQAIYLLEVDDQDLAAIDEIRPQDALSLLGREWYERYELDAGVSWNDPSDLIPIAFRSYFVDGVLRGDCPTTNLAWIETILLEGRDSSLEEVKIPSTQLAPIQPVFSDNVLVLPSPDQNALDLPSGIIPNDTHWQILKDHADDLLGRFTNTNALAGRVVAGYSRLLGARHKISASTIKCILLISLTNQ